MNDDFLSFSGMVMVWGVIGVAALLEIFFLLCHGVVFYRFINLSLLVLPCCLLLMK